MDYGVGTPMRDRHCGLNWYPVSPLSRSCRGNSCGDDDRRDTYEHPDRVEMQTDHHNVGRREPV